MLPYSELLSISKQLQNFWEPGVERCGLVLDNLTIEEKSNHSKTPERSFAFDLVDLMLSSVGTWHTHPTTSANLSIDDYRFFECWPNKLHWIVSQGEVWCYLVKDGIVYCVDEEDYSAWSSQGSVQSPD